MLKDSGDLLDLTHDKHCWRDDCTPDRVALTGPDSALRPGLHACQVGTLYGWSLGGRVPAVYDTNRHGYERLLWPDGGQKGEEGAWPDTAFVRTSNMTRDERNRLEEVALALEKHVDDAYPTWKQSLIETVQDLLDRPTRSPYIAFRGLFPEAGRLKDGEKYPLYRWLLKQDRGQRLVYAYPAWLVVTAGRNGGHEWRMSKQLCPRCGKEAGGGKQVEHGTWCRQLWAEAGWR